MTDESKLSQAAAKGNRASQLLENDVYIESFKALEDELIKAWIDSEPRDAVGRERCFAQVHANRRQRDFFMSIVNNGKLAAAELHELEQVAERKKRFGIL